MQNTNTDIKLYIVRHGQAVGNLDNDAMAIADDADLTERGKDEVLMVAGWFKKKNIPISAIYSSNSKRALETAAAIADVNGFNPNAIASVGSLVELSVGDWAQKKISEVISPEVELTLNAKGIDFVWPGGESFRKVERRISAWLEEEILHNQKYISNEQHIVIVAHGNAIRALFYYILGCNDRLIHRFRVDNCSLSIFNYKKFGWHTITINSTDHLYGID